MRLSEILNKDDKALFSVCLKVLGESEFNKVKAKAIEAALYCAKDSPELKKVNIARRAINSVMVIKLKRKGITNWRQLLDK
ncbi:hypothetical protein [Vibrio anguillarum]|uniref:Uncharacterized protein n=5 Tax=Vibrio anguillarum TaxID=55601 RepID=A0A1Y0NUH9_VIBAN|nr:hypothetical protein [Vibrio anguillarum]AOT26267.1 hypothetical protein Her_0046 [Vibrio phage Her]AOT26358.1 hypothetical protein CLA_0046 [Vibrio phage Cla]AOT26540.1 hypothetical protein Pel_0046 [Vibrio phage Pel]AOT26631.1 hypothetical protein pVa2_0045 [Vibrio phage pVa-2]AOT26722.1 hypothetical protein pVa1_0046 [Vibrio phage pVa-1]AOT26813.1 hypothetical protein pVa5_0046 [Vibrio phage vB_VspP_pVa5_12Jun]AOT26904.1 hypothetical protein pVa6_0046 [Vibrio phage pVa-6]AOT27091.1 hy